MKTIVISLIVAALAGVYAWWWHLPVAEMRSMVGAHVENMDDLASEFPNLELYFRLRGIDIFTPSDDAGRDAIDISSSLASSSAINMFAGVAVAAFALGVATTLAGVRIRNGGSPNLQVEHISDSADAV